MLKFSIIFFISLFLVNAGTISSPVEDTPTISGVERHDMMFLALQLKQVETLVYGKKYNTAIKKLRNLEQKYPDNADIENYLGFSYRKLGELGKSAYHYNNALRINPRHVGALEYQGELFILYRQFENARRNLKLIKNFCGVNCEEYLELKAALEKSE